MWLDRRERGLFYQNHDISQVIEKFHCTSQDQHLTEGVEGLVPPLACSFCVASGYQHVVCTADEDGMIVLYDTQKSGEGAFIKEWEGHSNAVFDVAWSHDGRGLISGSGDQTAVMWDVTSGVKLDTFKGHTSSVKSVNFRFEDNNVFVTGSRDGHVMMWDRRVTKKDGSIPPVNIVRRAHYTKPQETTTPKRRRSTKLLPALDCQQSVTSVISQDGLRIISSGAVDGSVKIWDERKTYSTLKGEAMPLFCLPYAGQSVKKIGFSCLHLDSSRTQLFASCTDDVIYQFDCTSFNQIPVHCYCGHQNSTFFVRTAISVDDLYLISGSSDHYAYIWKIGDPLEGPVKLTGHTGEVTSVDWCSNDLGKLVTLSDDNTTRIWRLNLEGRASDIGEVVGMAEKSHKEIGVTANESESVVRKAACLLSPSVKSPRATVAKVTFSPHQTKTTPKLKDTKIKRWFTPNANSKLLTNYKPKSPRKILVGMSPRKLLITPQKPNKRKLDSNQSPKSIKKLCLELEAQKENADVGNCQEKCSPKKMHSPRQAFSEVKVQVKGEGQGRQLQFAATEKEECKVCEDVNSPTSNLPNLIFDQHKIRTFDMTPKRSKKSKGVDWLTKLTQRKKVIDDPKVLSDNKELGRENLTKMVEERRESSVESKTAIDNRTSTACNKILKSKQIESYFTRKAKAD